MTSIVDLRASIGPVNHDILSRIWKYRVSTGDWVPVRVLHKLVGGKAAVRPRLEQLGGSIVYETNEAGTKKYGLTLLGILLSAEGERLETLLAKYLAYACGKALAEPLRTHVSSAEASGDLQLTSIELVELGLLLRFSPLSSGGGFGSAEWSAGLPNDIEDLPQDLLAHVREAALRDYDPGVPLDPSERSGYLWGRRKEAARSPVWFVADDDLRARAESDWAEAQRAISQRVWKGSVILCGGVLEGVLLDALLRQPDNAATALAKLHSSRKPKPLAKWHLNDLVEVATTMGILAKSTSYLSHAVREYRNLVHPGHDLSEKREVTQREAEIAFKSVETCLEELATSAAARRIP